MKELNDCLKKYLIVNYTKYKLNKCRKNLLKSLPWIQGKSIFNTINTHMSILLNTLFSEQTKQSWSEDKYFIDSMFKYTLEKSENLVKLNKKVKNIKSYMQLNSYIVFDEISKGLQADKDKKSIDFNIEKRLCSVQEKIDLKINMDEILQNVINQ